MGRPRKPLTEQRGNLTVITMQTREAEEDSVFKKMDTASSRQMFDRNAALGAGLSRNWKRSI